MTATANQLLEEIRQLTVEERIDLALAIWEELPAEDLAVLSVPEEHKQLLDQRIAAYEANPDDTLSWEEVKLKLKERLA